MSNVETVTVTLSSPIDVDKQPVSELTFREAELSDLCAADHFEGQMSKTAAILAGMANVPVMAIKKLKARDIATILDKAGHLMGNEMVPTTGGKSPS